MVGGTLVALALVGLVGLGLEAEAAGYSEGLGGWGLLALLGAVAYAVVRLA